MSFPTLSGQQPNPVPSKPTPPDTRLGRRQPIVQFAVVALLALFVAVSALPQYVGGWAWASPPKLPAATRNALQAMPDNGLDIPNWVTTDQNKIRLGGATWSVQQLSAASATPQSNAPVAFFADAIANPMKPISPK